MQSGDADQYDQSCSKEQNPNIWSMSEINKDRERKYKKILNHFLSCYNDRDKISELISFN